MSISASLEHFEPRSKRYVDSHSIDDGRYDDILSNSPHYQQRGIANDEKSLNNECWTIREIYCGEEELFVKDKFVYHTMGKGPNSIIISTYNFSEQVLDAFWCSFAKNDHICIVVLSGLHIFNNSGHHYQIPLPFAFDKLHPTNHGLIIERKPDADSDPSLPVLFSLRHPTYEVSPVLMKNSHKFANVTSNSTSFQSASKSLPQGMTSGSESLLDSKHNSSFLLPNSMTVVACHETLSLCLMFNSGDGQHSLWRYRPTKSEELEDLKHYKEQSTQMASIMSNETATFNSFKDNMSLHNSNQASSINLSNRAKSSLIHSTSNNPANNFSPKIELKNRHSMLDTLAASRLGSGGLSTVASAATMISEHPQSISETMSFSSSKNQKFMSTPNKTNFLNYLRDDVEEPILPEFIFEQIWCESDSGSLKAEKFFSTLDFVGNEFFVIVTPAAALAKVIKYDITNDKSNLAIGQVKKLDIHDALPIPSLKMMIVIELNKNLGLYSGLNKVADLSLGQSDTIYKSLSVSSPANQTTQSINMTPIQMSSARKRISVGGKSLDDYIFRDDIFQAISPVPHVVYSKSNKWHGLCPSEISSLRTVLVSSVIVTHSKNMLGRFQLPSLSTTRIVSNLLDAMKSLVSKDMGLYILSKWYSARRCASQPKIMTANQELRFFKNWFLGCLGVAGDYFEDSDVCKSANSPFDLISVSPAKRSKKSRDTTENPMLANIYSIFHSFHLIYEDLKLSMADWQLAHELVDLLLVIACLLRQSSYQEYYWQNFPSLKKRYGEHKSKLEGFFPKNLELHKPHFYQSKPFSIYEFTRNIIRVYENSLKQGYQSREEFLNFTPYHVINDLTNNSKLIISLFSEMYGISYLKSVSQISAIGLPCNNSVSIRRDNIKRSKSNDEKVVLLLAEANKTQDYLQSLAEGYSLYLWDSIINCRHSPPTDWSEACYLLIGRTDLLRLVSRKYQAIPNPVCCNTYVDEDVEIKKVGRNSAIRNSSKGSIRQRNQDDVIRLLFPDDQRVSEAYKMLSSDKPVEFHNAPRPGVTEEEANSEADKHLLLLNIRTMAIPLGRGAIDLRTYSPVIGKVFQVPKLNLSGWNGERTIETNHDSSVYPWPHFHNGVAAGLKICKSNQTIDSTWINYSRPKSNVLHGGDVRDRDATMNNINNEHAGFLFALGLNGHLAKLSLMTIHDYLCQNNDLTRVAILLGLSAAKRASCDKNMIKVLSIHIDALLPPTSTELDVPAIVQVASILGVGLLYQGSGDSHISKVLLDEIGRLPGQENNSQQDRESYSMAAGVAFGLVNLCKGSSKANVAAASTISASDQLRQYMLGGKRKQLATNQKQRYFKQDCHRGEAEYINPHVTSAGGTLALGLMYHKSENESVANWMLAPDTQSLLEYVRPDSLILRMLSYGLIMWSKVEPTKAYICSHVPEIVTKYGSKKATNSTKSDDDLLCFESSSGVPIDFETMCQSYCSIIVGCCMAIALKYAGSADEKAFRLISQITRNFIKRSCTCKATDIPGRSTIEACLNILITSLAVVMAGTGNLEVLRMCRYLRSRLIPNSILYGSYMAVHMAMGILFLGNCRLSLGTSPEAISALVCALYPIYPNHTSDNRYHLQALRHLYVLASEPRLLIPLDIQTCKPVYANITLKRLTRNQQTKEYCHNSEISEKGDNDKKSNDGMLVDASTMQTGNIDSIVEQKLKAPCLVSDIDSVISICVEDEHYWREQIDNKEALVKYLFQEGGCLHVKKKDKSGPSHTTDNELLFAKLSNLDNAIDNNSLFSKLMLQQLKLADSVTEITNFGSMNMTNRFKPILNMLESDKKAASDTLADWIQYASGKTDWTNTNDRVLQYMILHDISKSNLTIDNNFLDTLSDIQLEIENLFSVSSDNDEKSDEDSDVIMDQ